MKTEIYLSMGSNQGERLNNLVEALKLLPEKGILLKKISAIYETTAVGYTFQPDFLNLVVCALTSLKPLELLDVCLAIEKQLGRVRNFRWGPRTLDLDILFYGTLQMTTPCLQIPHPRLKERAFVLVPLREIAPQIFQRLQVAIPAQKIELLISAQDVKLRLQKQGLFFD
ncbi:MAG TPA: 2-amino-4-hydroxy-6-hydroxymethyldihydropteridine diphosphokinase [Clostridia bacterium]|jgi:2-amino-4-hydroxy-6-hydroxymethyldihydropteridine diphosphokinase|nr:2-amino-4-hydroxy-6-hydroxymethyldihydropteridine diphosphokinase [Clostridia bacterium]